MSDALHPFDRVLRRLTRRVAAIGPSPVTAALAPLRARALDRVVDVHRAAADRLAPALAAGQPAARTALARLAEQALAEMRAQVRGDRDGGAVRRALAASDALFGDCDEGEYLDDPDLDAGLRQRLMSCLDALNDVIESYDTFLDQLVLHAGSDRPTRVLDLAAGHGGFALAATRAARARGLDLRFTATDIKQEYLDLGAAAAAREGLDVEFAVQDALDLHDIEPGAYDVVTCTQSLHHFPPGLIAVMFEEAARVAGRAVVFVDGCRSLVTGTLLYVVGTLRYRNTAFAHDAWVSARRFFVPEELALLARLGSWGEGVDARWIPPGHCLLHLDTARHRAAAGRPA